MTGVVTLSIYISRIVIPSTRDADSNRVMALSIWMFFVVVNAYYGGAMTMFFANTISIDLETKRDVLQAYPDWHLIFKDGVQSKFIEYAILIDYVNNNKLFFHLRKILCARGVHLLFC